MAKMVVNVSVAQIWTAPSSPRAVDAPLLTNPVDINGWLQTLGLEQRLELYEADLVQTQALYGTQVIAVDEQDEWVKVAIPTQPSIKDERGYPGWMPKSQLSPCTQEMMPDTGRTAVVTVPTAHLYRSETEVGMEVSFPTRLPVIEVNDSWVQVATPHGRQLLRRQDVKLVGNGQREQIRGEQMVETGKMFLELPYLWSGMSAYGFDCSGFVHSLHRFYGIIIPRDASNQAMAGQMIEPDQLQPGDLLFFAHDQGRGKVHHVGMYAGDGMMIHSPKTGKSIEIIPLAGYEYEKEHCISRRYW
ncbi:MAG: C40 family peptidase [Brevibacillus sp.]|nr:C40 family peptidase [Brevibacillus sp.]